MLSKALAHEYFKFLRNPLLYSRNGWLQYVYTYQPNYIMHFPQDGNVDSSRRSNLKSVLPIFTIMSLLYIFRARYANYRLNICVQMQHVM